MAVKTYEPNIKTEREKIQQLLLNDILRWRPKTFWSFPALDDDFHKLLEKHVQVGIYENGVVDMLLLANAKKIPDELNPRYILTDKEGYDG